MLPTLLKQSTNPTTSQPEEAYLLYTNADGLLNKMIELKVVLSSGKYNIVCITESQFNKNTPNASISIPGFEEFREDRAGRRKGRGSIVYVHESYTAEKLKLFDGLESVALDISNHKGHSFILV